MPTEELGKARQLLKDTGSAITKLENKIVALYKQIDALDECLRKEEAKAIQAKEK